jgi:hypothetical protein
MKFTRKQQQAFDTHKTCRLELRDHCTHTGIFCQDHDHKIAWIAQSDKEKAAFLLHTVNTLRL